MAEDWGDLAAAITRYMEAYMNVLASRAEDRDGSKKRKAAEKAYLEAHSARYEAALAHWREEDGMLGEFKRVGPAIQRYYADMAKAAAADAKRGK